MTLLCNFLQKHIPHLDSSSEQGVPCPADEEVPSEEASESSDSGGEDGSPAEVEAAAGDWQGPQAGCTAVAAIVRGNSLYVANAGGYGIQGIG